MNWYILGVLILITPFVSASGLPYQTFDLPAGSLYDEGTPNCTINQREEISWFGTKVCVDSYNFSTYQPKIKFDTDTFFGACNFDSKENFGVFNLFECVGNFFDPTIPNPLYLFEPIRGQQITNKVSMLDPTKVAFEDYGKYFLNLFIILFSTVLELIFGMINYLIIFMIKFLIIYVFYISLGFQTLIFYLNGQRLESRDKIISTSLIMAFVTIYSIGVMI